ncbi:MAG: hypothetical protein KAS32_02725 [Candidatus Peribacteraceae bacterium]|nr:hypothetical protein [Candidatus Peribacteraceae bacterium]
MNVHEQTKQIIMSNIEIIHNIIPQLHFGIKEFSLMRVFQDSTKTMKRAIISECNEYFIDLLYDKIDDFIMIYSEENPPSELGELLPILKVHYELSLLMRKSVMIFPEVSFTYLDVVKGEVTIKFS